MMKAVIVKKPKTLVIKDIPEPRVGSDDVLLKVKYVSLCNATDVHIYEGTARGYLDFYPQILGHEVFGEVVETGKNVKNVKIHDRIVMYHLQSLCEYIVFSPKQEMFGKAPGNIPDEQVPLCEMFHGAMVQTVYPANIKKGEKVCVIGQGPMGLVMTQLVKMYEPEHIVTTDLNEFRLELSRRLGATHTYNVAKYRTDELVRRLRKDVGEIDLCIVCIDVDLSPTKDAYNLAGRILRNDGRLTGLGVFAKGVNHTINPQTIYSKNLKLARSLEDVYPKQEDKNLKKQKQVFQTAINWVADGKINFRDMVSRILPIDKIKQGLDLCRNRPDKVIKVVIKI